MKRLLLFLALWPLTAGAHDPGLSSLTLDLGSRDILVQVAFAPADLGALNSSTYPELAARSVELRTAGSVLLPTFVEVREISAADVEFILRFPRPTGEAVLRSPLLASLPFGHRQAVTLRDPNGAPQLTELLSSNHDSIPLPGASALDRSPTKLPHTALLQGAAGVGLVALALGAVWLARHRRLRAAF